MRALLAIKNSDSKSHAGVITLFSQHYIKEKLVTSSFNKLIREAKVVREKADYGDFFVVEREKAEKHLKQADEFLRQADELLRKLIFEQIQE